MIVDLHLRLGGGEGTWHICVRGRIVLEMI